MILYSLACDAGHRFESWFGSSIAFDTLVGQGVLSCPTCGSSRVAKTIMAPAIVANRVTIARPDASSSSDTAAPSVEVALLDDKRLEARRVIKAFHEKVMAETLDVGSRFPDEARRMQDGKIPHREIRGQASLEEARALLEDGVMILPLPTIPEELN